MFFMRILLIYFLTFSFCSAQIISFELVRSWSISDVQQMYNSNGLPSNVGEINFAVDGYKILYFTPNFDGNLVLCSGAIYLPKETICPSPVLSWQHGTSANDSWVPSNIDSDNNVIGVVAASHGYIVTMSDFVGLGDGVGFHNYMHADTQSSSSIDLIIMGKQFAYDKGVIPNSQLFLIGYSQGGHATMGMVREIQENYNDQLEVTASAPMAGPYSMSGVMRDLMLSGMPYPNPGYLPYVLFSYQNIYNLFDDVTEIMLPPYNQFLFGMYNGSNSMTSINAMLPSDPIEIFKDDFYDEFVNDPNHPLNIALFDNDVYDFVPQSPMKLLHCNGDLSIPIENAELAYNHFIDAGAIDIYFEDGGNYGHTACAQLAIIGSKLWIDTMSDICEPESTDISESFTSNQRKLVGIFDLIGRDVDANTTNNQILLYLYNDGSFEKRHSNFETQIQR